MIYFPPIFFRFLIKLSETFFISDHHEEFSQHLLFVTPICSSSSSKKKSLFHRFLMSSTTLNYSYCDASWFIWRSRNVWTVELSSHSHFTLDRRKVFTFSKTRLLLLYLKKHIWVDFKSIFLRFSGKQKRK